ncbi:MAG: pyridoxamine 5'-phosphate oxidase family protein [Proteobacteria bacterium]|nr:pyridoxamine 5'-phosphate oxidase family protein [Pseudomonadota bacterium]
MNAPDGFAISDRAGLRAHYGEPQRRSVAKCLERLDGYARRFIALSPLLVIGSAGADGSTDVSPKGDVPGFVKVLDDTTLLIPDRPGNRRVDTLANLLERPGVGLLFFVPGMNETLRVNGTASVTAAPDLLDLMVVNGKRPVAAIRVAVEEVFFHCAKALIRSRLWDPSRHIDRAEFPSLARMICEQIGDPDVAAAEAHSEQSIRERLY